MPTLTRSKPVFSAFLAGVAFFAAGFFAGVAFFGIVTYYRNRNLHKQIDWLEDRVKLGNSISYRVKIAGEKSFNEIHHPPIPD